MAGMVDGAFNIELLTAHPDMTGMVDRGLNILLLVLIWLTGH